MDQSFFDPAAFHERLLISTRQCARIVRVCVTSMELGASGYCTRLMQRIKVTQVHKKKGKLRAVALLWGYTEMKSNVGYRVVELLDVVSIAEAISIIPTRRSSDGP